MRFRHAMATLALAVIASATSAQEPLSYSGTVEPCLSPHGDKDRYAEGLQSVGWTPIPDDGRSAALGMLADAFLPVTQVMDESWADSQTDRARALAFWMDLSQNRLLLAREDQVLLLAGFATDLGEMIVECWVAGPSNNGTDNFLALAGTAYQGNGIVMTQLNLPDDPARPKTEIFVSRLEPPVAVEPPLSATDGLRTRITFMRPEVNL